MSFQRRVLYAIAVVICEATLLDSQSAGGKRDAADILRTFKTIYVQSKTPLAKPQMLAGELQKSDEFDKWNLSISSDFIRCRRRDRD